MNTKVMLEHGDTDTRLDPFPLMSASNKISVSAHETFLQNLQSLPKVSNIQWAHLKAKCRRAPLSAHQSPPLPAARRQ